MNPIFRNILALVAGIIVGGIVNMALIMLGPNIIAPPDGFDPSNMESLKEHIHLFEPRHFIFPFLAHALGTLAGAFIAAKFSANNHMKFALGIGVFYLIMGTINVFILDAPLWYDIVDLLGAYIPMGYLGGILAGAKMQETTT